MKKTYLLLITLALLATSCTQVVPAGFKGMIRGPGGLSGEVLEPGNHSCFGRDQMMLIAGNESVNVEKLKILTKEKVNLSVDVKVMSYPDLSPKNFTALLDKQGALMTGNSAEKILQAAPVYQTYVKSVARTIAREVISPYPLQEVSDNRKAISAEIDKRVKAAVKGAPVVVRMVMISNIDFPAVITNAKENAMKREVQIQEEEAKMAVELLKMENRKKLAEKRKIVRAKEAQAEKAYTQIMGSGLSASYLKYLDIMAKDKLFGKVAPGDKVIIGADQSFLVGAK